ncbi:hypothetical protein RS022_02730 [Candidatus Phytoplasma rubi]|uniref:Phage protein n=1 Tax=Candidatus Phytoplasma rubi TaxID=399025 RepID=A0ABY7BTZ3_9MOLU|nr:hypothetical protein RS022_02730 [Candidatus Phytoplasma rubi]
MNEKIEAWLYGDFFLKLYHEFKHNTRVPNKQKLHQKEI